MVEIGLAEYFGMAEAMGIIGTMFVVLYFSRKQTQKLSEDIETKVSKRFGPKDACSTRDISGATRTDKGRGKG